jgi:hypothetical protein
MTDSESSRPRKPADATGSASPTTRDEWAAELQAALTAVGSNWRVFKAWVERNSPMMYADLTSVTLGAKRITLARDRFTTVNERRTEILRQLRGDSPPDGSNTGRRKGGDRL